ncbi:MAG: TatD family hydrolase [Patescibacteria group bacterium]|nr:TatD family hydrolase [Patescibacteria group bacterium]
MPRLIDVHTHLQFAAYEDKEKVIRRALDEDIWLVNVGTQKDTSWSAVTTAKAYEKGVYATIGLHPIHTTKSYHDVNELGGGEAAEAFTSKGEEFDFDFYKELGKNEQVVAIGECGLDYYRLDEESKEKQFEAFEAQIELAKKLERPLMIHCREAFGDLVELLKKHKSSLLSNRPGINHFFAGSKEDARALIDLGFSFSFGGVITFTHDYDEVIRYIGLDRIVLETDAPYVAPVPHRGKRNEPGFIVHTAERLAEILEVTVGEVETITTRNAREILNI